MLRELVVLPAGEPFNAADPESSIFGAAQAVDRVRRVMLTCGRLPGNASATIETEQAEVHSEPEATIGSLGDRSNCAFGEALANLPRRVGILIHAERRIKREGTDTPNRDDGRQLNPQRDRMPHSSPIHQISYILSRLSFGLILVGQFGWPTLERQGPELCPAA